ncbi:MAG: orotidine-5'-phosphate decarboxylase [Bacteroidales bacterium]|jgi:orotidine-5'-phosphate decarboxylase|nr:orotidine-5'-phosphate decarboxylase [Bacteroidales bacterium]NLM91647.1 orotidine-5'-phosphate decarboxylase [Bacteroidales bacterium]
MTRQELVHLIRQKRSYLCVGLDSDLEKIPGWLREESDDPVFEFNKGIINATIDFAVAYKPNLAFYESRGSQGWQSLEKTMAYLAAHPSGPVFSIADAKRGDIGNSATQYARAFLERLDFDSITVNPYMGQDTLQPFLNIKGKWAIVLALTSNPGANDFQLWQPQLPMLLERLGIKTEQWKRFFELIIEQSQQWGTPDNLMFVVGATRPEMLQNIRQIAPVHFFLIPGVGAQGGSLEDVSRLAMTKDCGILVNVSRNIIFASSGRDFAQKAGEAALSYQQQMEKLLAEKKVV